MLFQQFCNDCYFSFCDYADQLHYSSTHQSKQMTTQHAPKDGQTASCVFAWKKKGTNRCKIGKIASLKTTYYLVRDKPDASGTHCVCFLCTCLRIHFSSLFQCLNIECRTVAVLGVDFLPHFFEMHSTSAVSSS